MTAEVILLGRTTDRRLDNLARGTDVDIWLDSGPMRGRSYSIVVGDSGLLVTVATEQRRLQLWHRLRKKGRFKAQIPVLPPAA